MSRSDLWDGPATIDVDSRTWQVRACRSALEVREVLSSRDEAQPLVILTQVSHTELGPDVTARLVKRRVIEVDAWEPVLRAFGAHRIDARLVSHGWLSDVLLTGTPVEGYPQTASGTLDAATAWRGALKILLGVDSEALDLTTLLEWTLDPSVLSKWVALPRVQAADIVKWLKGAVGPSAELPLALIANGHGVDAVPVAIVCGVLFADEDEPSGVRGAAAIRLERWTDGLHVDARRGRTAATTADGLLARLRVSGEARTILFAPPAAGLLGVHESGGAAMPVAMGGADDNARWPTFLPDGNHFLYLLRSREGQNRGVFVGALNSSEQTHLLDTDRRVPFVPPNRLLFVRQAVLMSQIFDPEMRRLSGQAIPLVQESASSDSGYAAFSASNAGLLTWAPARQDLLSLVCPSDTACRPTPCYHEAVEETLGHPRTAGNGTDATSATDADIDWTGMHRDRSPIRLLDDQMFSVRLRLLSDRAESLMRLRQAFLDQPSHGQQFSRDPRTAARRSR